jgi:hypothetical protein
MESGIEEDISGSSLFGVGSNDFMLAA